MSLRPVIDALDFARNAGTHHGKIALCSLERLQDYLAGNSGELQYEVTGALNGNGKPILRVSVQGLIKLRCQRCLGELGHVLDLRADLLLAENEKELSAFDEDEKIDGILAEPDLDVLALIEDEIILSLPVSPRHSQSECAIRDRLNADTAAKNSSFAALAALRKLH